MPATSRLRLSLPSPLLLLLLVLPALLLPMLLPLLVLLLVVVVQQLLQVLLLQVLVVVVVQLLLQALVVVVVVVLLLLQALLVVMVRLLWALLPPPAWLWTSASVCRGRLPLLLRALRLPYHLLADHLPTAAGGGRGDCSPALAGALRRGAGGGPAVPASPCCWSGPLSGASGRGSRP